MLIHMDFNRTDQSTSRSRELFDKMLLEAGASGAAFVGSPGRRRRKAGRDRYNPVLGSDRFCIGAFEPRRALWVSSTSAQPRTIDPVYYTLLLKRFWPIAVGVVASLAMHQDTTIWTVTKLQREKRQWMSR